MIDECSFIVVMLFSRALHTECKNCRNAHYNKTQAVIQNPLSFERLSVLCFLFSVSVCLFHCFSFSPPFYFLPLFACLSIESIYNTQILLI